MHFSNCRRLKRNEIKVNFLAERSIRQAVTLGDLGGYAICLGIEFDRPTNMFAREPLTEDAHCGRLSFILWLQNLTNPSANTKILRLNYGWLYHWFGNGYWRYYSPRGYIQILEAHFTFQKLVIQKLGQLNW